MYATLDRTEALTRAVLAEIPPGSYSFTEYFEDDYISDVPVRIVVKLTARGDGTVELDFTGSDPQVRAALNLPTGGMQHHPFLSMSVVNYVVTKSEAIHINAGILRCIDLVLPEASVVNASFPAACGMRFTTAMRVHDLILGALTKAMPGKVPVAGLGGAGRHLHLDLGTGRRRTGGGRQPGVGRLRRQRRARRHLRHRDERRLSAQRAGRGIGGRGAGRGAPLRPGARQRGTGQVPRRVRRRLRPRNPPSQRRRRDARQGPPELLRLGRRPAARPARPAAISARGRARRRTISASAPSTAPNSAN